jgi:hypothetical protein
VIARKSQLTYAVVNQRGEEFVIHVNRIKKAYDPSIWKEKEKDAGKVRTKRRKTEEEVERALLPASNPFRPLVTRFRSRMQAISEAAVEEIAE